MTELPPRYNPQDVEEKWFKLWAESDVFHARILPGKKPYTIVIPPPNVTGILHMGHALNNTIQDILIRAKRMQGFEALWMPGTDHAGIATQNVVERQIAQEGFRRQDLGREEFLRRVWRWKEEHGSTIIHQLKRMGATCDWRRERFTMDEGYSPAVVEAFVRLYEKGLIYRGDYIINWCPRCQTALADEEAPHRELDGKLYYLKYPLKKSTVPACPAGRHSPQSTKKSKSADRGPSSVDYVVVATTRPETMLGDTAVAVHPSDRRYKRLIGATLILPLLEREIKIIADDFVDKKFGTGAVKVTPAHDPNDYAMGLRHGLAFLNIMNPDGVLNASAGDYAGLDRFEAREAIVEDLRERRLLLKIEDHRRSVGHCYRCHTVVEPYLSKQWFVRMKPLAGPAIRAVKDGELKFHPRRWTKVYLNWMEGIRDWCISRQIWWGHRLPVYYCKNCTMLHAPSSMLQVKEEKPAACNLQLAANQGIIVSKEKPDKCPTCGSTELKQDEDVLDTWFSSWLWPFATFGWPFIGQQSTVPACPAGRDRPQTAGKSESADRGPSTADQMKADLEYFYPTSTLVTAPEIIFFWVARMVMAGCEFMGKPPFRDVYIHGTVRDAEGRKMSKSLGNSIDPLGVISEYGADALRFSLIALAATGSDIHLSKEKFEQGRNFANKIWNASRFILMNLGADVRGALPAKSGLTVQDSWILAQLNDAVKRSTRAIDQFKLNEALGILYDFFWHKFCDWYLEIAKRDIAAIATQEVLLFVLRRSLILLHPFMPFLTQELLGFLSGAGREAVLVEEWPKTEGRLEDPASAQTMAVVLDCVLAARNLRAVLKLDSGTVLSVTARPLKLKEQSLQEALPLIEHLVNAKSVLMTAGEGVPRNSLALFISPQAHFYVLLAGLVDAAKEKEKLNGRMDECRRQIKQKEALLSNKAFAAKAPAEVVEKERSRVTELKETLTRLEEIVHAFG